MIDFGYQINEGVFIDLDKGNPELQRILDAEEPSFRLCISCGACTATCSAGRFTNFNFRKLQLMIKRGMTEEVKNEIGQCMFCGKCMLVCPRGVNTRNVIFTIQKALNLQAV